MEAVEREAVEGVEAEVVYRDPGYLVEIGAGRG